MQHPQSPPSALLIVASTVLIILPITTAGTTYTLTDQQDFLKGSLVDVDPDGSPGDLKLGTRNHSDSSLVGYWRLDDDVPGEGGTVMDYSGNGNDGTTNNGVTTGVDGIRDGEAMEFDGGDDYVELPLISNYTASDSFTVSAWVRTTDSNAEVIQRSSLSTGGWFIRINSDGNAYLRVIGPGSDDNIQVTSDQSVNDGTWHHLAFTYHGDQSMTAFLDGEHIGTDNNSALEGKLFSDQDIPMAIGVGGRSENYFNGKIDQAQIYGRALTPSEIKQLYNPSPGIFTSQFVNGEGANWLELGWQETLEQDTDLEAQARSADSVRTDVPDKYDGSVLGSQRNPGTTCHHIHQVRPNAPSGSYWIGPGGSEPFEVYCDMERDGGGWTLVGKSWGNESDTSFPLSKEEYLTRVMNVNGYNQGDLTSDTVRKGFDDGFAFLSRQRMQNLFHQQNAHTYRVEYRGSNTFSSDSWKRFVLKKLDHPSTPYRSFDAWHAIRNTKLFGTGTCNSEKVDGQGTEYKAEVIDNYNPLTHTITQTSTNDCGIGHWDDGHTYTREDGNSYDVSRHGITGDIDSGGEWLFILSESDSRFPHGVDYNRSRVWIKEAPSNITWDGRTETSDWITADELNWVQWKTQGGQGLKPVNQWRLGTGSGQIAIDHIGKNNGTLGDSTNGESSDPDWDENCRYRGCLDFDGEDDYVDFGDPVVDTSQPFTAALWVKIDSDDSGNHILNNHNNNQGFTIESPESYHCDLGDGSTWHTADTNTNIRDSKWHHLAIVFDGNEMGCYLDGGIERSSVEAEGSNPPENLWLGESAGYSGNNVKMHADDVRIYDRALSANELQNLYHSPSQSWQPSSVQVRASEADPAADSLVGSWSFEGTGQSILDSSGNGNTGTLGGNVSTYSNSDPQRVSGYSGQGIEFDGDDEYVEIDDAPSLDITNAVSMSAWVKPSESTWHALIARRGYEYHTRLLIDSSNQLFYETWNGNKTRSSDTVSIGKWNHVATVLKERGSDVIATFYINGQKTNSVTVQDDSINWDSSANLWLGGNILDVNYTLDGVLDEVRIYDSALSQSAVEDLYNISDFTRALGDNWGERFSITNTNNDGQKFDPQYYQYKINFLTGDSSSIPQVSKVTLANASDWSPWFSDPAGNNLDVSNNRYAQAQFNFSSEAVLNTPLLESFSVESNFPPSVISGPHLDVIPTEHRIDVSAIGHDGDGDSDFSSCTVFYQDQSGDTGSVSGTVDSNYGSNEEAECTASIDPSLSDVQTGDTLQITVQFTDVEGAKGNSSILSDRLAIYAPGDNYDDPNWINGSRQEEIAADLATNLSSFTTDIYNCGEASSFGQWTEDHINNGERDTVLILDTMPWQFYNNSEDGSTAEEWLDAGNNIIWTGDLPFYEYGNECNDSSIGSNHEWTHINDVLDSNDDNRSLIDNQGLQQVTSAGSSFTPTLEDYDGRRALNLSLLNNKWAAASIFAKNTSNMADAVAIKDTVTDGMYAQFHTQSTANSDKLPRSSVIQEFLQRWFDRTATIPNNSPDIVSGNSFTNYTTRHAFNVTAVVEDVDEGSDELDSCTVVHNNSETTYESEGTLDTGYGSIDEAECCPVSS